MGFQGFFGGSWTEIIDFLLKLGTTASILVVILARGYKINKDNRRYAVMIAKNALSRDAGRFPKKYDIL